MLTNQQENDTLKLIERNPQLLPLAENYDLINKFADSEAGSISLLPLATGVSDSDLVIISKKNGDFSTPVSSLRTLQNTPKSYAKVNIKTNQTCSQNVIYKVSGGTIVYDLGDEFNTTNGVFTAKNSGIYIVNSDTTFSPVLNAGASYVTLYLQKNGVIESSATGVCKKTATYESIAYPRINTVVNMNSGDNLQLAFQSGTNGVQVGWKYLDIALIQKI